MSLPEPECDFSVLEQAAEWFALLKDDAVSEQDRYRWQAWLNASPHHELAWRRVEQISRHFERIPQDERREARIALQQGGKQTRRQALKLMALCLGGIVLSSGVANRLPWQEWSASYKTGIGEIKEFQVASNLKLWLNTNSAVDADKNSAGFLLHRGEIVVQAGNGAPSNTHVATSSGNVLGRSLRFQVRKAKDYCEVAVFSGEMQVAPLHASPLTIKAGQQARFTADRIVAIERLESRRAAWVNGMLMADNMRLGDFITELERYRHGYIGCDPQVADLRLVGAYPLADTDRILTALEMSLPIKVNYPLPWWVSISARV
ncbi:FecR family protein [Pseudomonas duriflava]|uniref:FecR family protein n=1 Tax=Pseudomonas duriflava TaxID=459528 RepID=A0A562QAN2_9PSED|nr:DUF4880 domain-containing protein [Pseudomonas duriflava]TWI53808.1 FecR family protein [Pseudomonas duriflava]